MYENQYGTGNAAYLRDPASAITQRKYALAQALQKQGMDTSPVVGTGNNTMQAIARVLQGGLGAFMGSRVEDEAATASKAQRDERQQAQAAILGQISGQAAPMIKGPEVPEGAAPMPQRLGDAPPATPEQRAEIERNPLLAPGGRDLNGRPSVPVQPVAQGGAMPPPGDPQRYAALLAQRDANLGADPATLAQASAARGATGAPQIAGGYGSPPGVAGQFAGLAPPSGVINPTIGGTPGAAARTGGTDMAGPGIPQGPPAEGATSPKPAPPSEQRTPEQLRVAAARVVALGGTAAQAQMLTSQADAIERRQFQSENITETRRLQGEAAEERRAGRASDDARQAEMLRLAQEKAKRDGDTSEWIPDPARPGAMTFRPGGPQDPAVIAERARARGEGRGGRVIPGSERNSMVEAATRAGETTALRDTFKPEYGGFGRGVIGDVVNAFGRNTPGESPRADWWSRYQSQKNQVRNSLFGSALTPTEASEYEKADINPGMSADAIQTNLKRQAEIITTAQRRRVRSMAADGYNTKALLEASGIDPDETPPAAAAPAGNLPALPPGFTVVR